MGAHVEAFTGGRTRIVRYASRALAMRPLNPIGMKVFELYPSGTVIPFNDDLPNPYNETLPGFFAMNLPLGVPRDVITAMRLVVEFRSPFYSHDVSEVALTVDGLTYVDWTEIRGSLDLPQPWPTGAAMRVHIRGSYSRPGRSTPTSGLIASFYRLDLLYPS